MGETILINSNNAVKVINKEKYIGYTFEIKCFGENECILSFGEICDTEVILNKELVFCGESSKHMYGTKLVIIFEKGINILQFFIKNHKQFNVKIESYKRLIQGFWQDEYCKLKKNLSVKCHFDKNKRRVYIKVTHSFIMLKNIKINIVLTDFRNDIIEKDTFYSNSFCVDICTDNPLDLVIIKVACIINNEFYEKEDVILLETPAVILNKFSGKSCLRDNFLNIIDEKLTYEQRLYFLYCYKKDCDYDTKRIKICEYVSKLDDSTRNYIIALPEEYDEGRSYPILITIATDYSEYEKGVFIKKALQNKLSIILVLVDIRGITMGAYIGEAAFMETFELLNNAYPIDSQKIYLTGFSNGAFAVWNLVEKYPWKFAAVATLSGEADLRYLLNVYSLPILCVGATDDYELFNGYNSIRSLIGNYQNKKFVLIDNEEHSGYYFYYLCTTIIRWLMNSQYMLSDKIIYLSKGVNKYNNMIKILQLDNPQITSGFIIEKESNINFSIKIFNIKKIEIECNNLFAKEAVLYIEKEKIKIDTSHWKNLIVEKTKNGIQYYERQREKSSPHSICILDIYLEKVIVCVCNQDRILDQVANNFSKPYSSGWKNKIDVNFPILLNARVENINCNVIYILDNVKDATFKKYTLQYKINAIKDRIQYKNFILQGDYLLMFAARNIKNNKIILFVFATNKAYFSKSVFTRHLVIPSGVADEDHLLKKRIIIFDGKKYYSFQ